MNIDKMNYWIVAGKKGTSSETMWVALMKENVDPKFMHDIPYDPDDFSRCYELYKFALNKEDLNVIARVFPYWKPYVDNWDKLCEMFEKNVSENWVNSKEIGMYEFMKELRKQSDKIRYNK